MSDDRTIVNNTDTAKNDTASGNDDATRLTPERLSLSDDLSGHALPDDATRIQPRDCVNTVVSARPAAKTVVQGEHGVLKNRFVLEGVLGQGGMGTVYRAIDLRKREAGDEDCAVAVKVLGGNLEGHPEALTVLQREAKKAQLLAHPNVVTVYDFDRDGDLFFMTMELLKGQSLSDFIAEQGGGKKTRSLQLAIIRQLSQGLSYAHSRGLVHSDLKPDNVFLTDKNQVKIVDFGISRAYNEDYYHDQFDVGQLGAYTPRYASRGILEGATPAPADDIYALGLIACELLGGAHPYQGKSADVVAAQGLVPALPKGLNFFLRRLLKDSVDAGEQPTINSTERFLKRFDFARHWRKTVGMLAVIALAFIAVNFYLAWFYQEPEVAFSDLPLATQQKVEKFISEADLAMRFDDINGALMYLDRAYALHPGSDDVEARVDNILDHIQEYLAENPAELAAIRGQVEDLANYSAVSGSESYYRFKEKLAHSFACPDPEAGCR